MRKNLQIVVFLGKGLGGSLFHLMTVLLHQLVVDLDFRRSQGRSGNEFQVGVTNKEKMLVNT